MKNKEVAVVAMPRTGSTYLFRCLAGLPPGSGSPKGANLARLPIMKCHSLAPPEGFGDPWEEQIFAHCFSGRKVIWLFGDPIASVVSTMKKRFDHVHAKNCGCYRPLNTVDLVEFDHFNYEKMFDSWAQKGHTYPVLCVRYETMWKNRFVIEWFLERKVKWNEWKPRQWKTDDLPNFLLNALKKTYGSLIDKVETYPDVTLNGNGNLKVAGEVMRIT
jgi:hypothetical protein